MTTGEIVLDKKVQFSPITPAENIEESNWQV